MFVRRDSTVRKSPVVAFLHNPCPRLTKDSPPLARSICLAGALLLCAITVQAQTFRGQISGSVVDSSGGVVPNAEVKAINKSTQLVRTAQSSDTGDFSVPDLAVGLYMIEVSREGFQTQRLDNVEILVSKVTTLNLQMKVADLTETVEVTDGGGITLDTTSTALNGIIGPKQVQNLPLNGRDFRTMLQLSPGVTISNSVNGSRTRGNNYQIDGADNNDAFQNASAVNQGGVSGIAGTLLPIEAIDQFSVQSNGSAEVGRNGGGAVNLVIKSGTNDFHGSTYYFNRNEALAANSPVAAPGSKTRKIRNHQYGFSLGGPIIRDRTFFFTTFEGQRIRAANAIPTTAPSTAWIARAQALLTQSGVPVNAVSLNLLSLFPAESLSGPATANNFVSTDENDYYSDNGIAKIDHVFNERHNLSFRYFVGTGTQTAYDTNSPFGRYFQVAPSRMHNFSLVHTSVLTPQLVNQTVVGVNYFKQTFNAADTSADPVALGLNTGVRDPNLSGAPLITITGFSQVGGASFLPAGRVDTTWHVTNTLSYTRGAHAWKFGGEIRRAYLDIFYDSLKRGSFTFDGTVGPWRNLPQSPERALADFLAGYATANNGARIVRGDTGRDYRQNSFDLYAHDNWKAGANLNLNFGLRYTYQGVLSDVENTLTNFLPERGIVAVGADIDLLYPRDTNNFAPRVGFAYTPRKNGSTVIRGGYGLFHDVPAVAFFTAHTSLPNGGALGVGSNPGGVAPVYTITRSNLTLQPGVPVFGDAPLPPYGVLAVSQDFRTPYMQNFNLNVQQQLTRTTLLQLGYVGSVGTKLVLLRNINAPVPGNTATGQTLQTVQPLRPYNARFPSLGAINQLESVGRSDYNSLQVSLNQSAWRGLSAQFAYTYGHSIDNASEARNVLPANSYDLRSQRGNSDFDVRHMFRGSFTYDVPVFFESLPTRLTQGWQLNSILSFNTGSPFNVTAGTNRSNSFDGNDRVDLVGDPFADVVQNSTNRRFFNPGAFAQPALGTFGNLGRNVFYGPGFKAIDLSLFKTTALTERVAVQFRFEVFNLFNNVNWGNPIASLASPATVGQLTNTRNGSNAPGIGAGEPRNVQMALKVLF